MLGQLFSCMLAKQALYLLMKKKAPISAETPTGAVDRTAEAARVRNSIIRLLAANPQGDSQ
jgi:hypothetical protein